MPDTEIKADRDDRFRMIYKADMETLDSRSVNAQLVTTLDDALLGKISPQAAAEKTAALVMSVFEPEEPLATVLGICHSAALKLEDEAAQGLLAAFTVALMSLPDAVNENAKPKQAHTYSPEIPSGTLTFQPGDPIVLDEGEVLWRDLPGWSLMVAEEHQGPEMYLLKHRGKDEPPAAVQKFKNFNTYLAFLARSPATDTNRKLAGTLQTGLKTLAVALEYEAGDGPLQPKLWVPAAAQWMRIAGDRLAQVCVDGQKSFSPGVKWGHGEGCGSERFEFWKERLAMEGF